LLWQGNTLATDSLVTNATLPTDAQPLSAIKIVHDEFLGALMLRGANKDKYSALKADLTSQYGYKNDFYPKSISQCLLMLNCWTIAPPCKPGPGHTPPQAASKQDNKAIFLLNELTR
jgi:hypothetical protein